MNLFPASILSAITALSLVALAEGGNQDYDGEPRMLRTSFSPSVGSRPNYSMPSSPTGVNDIDFYTAMANRFVGLNPVSGEGSGFIYRESTETSMKAEEFGDAPDSGAGRNNLCTCECKPSASGIGCAGHAGINFRYGSLLWVDPVDGRAWTGQIQAFQMIPGGELNFVGTDTRFYPGGPAVYNVACTQQECGDLFAGVFRQYNDEVSCKAGLAEEENDPSSCKARCGSNGVYQDWLDYCAAPTDTSCTTGFSGYGK